MDNTFLIYGIGLVLVIIFTTAAAAGLGWGDRRLSDFVVNRIFPGVQFERPQPCAPALTLMTVGLRLSYRLQQFRHGHERIPP